MTGWLPPWGVLLSGFALLPPVGTQAQAAGAHALQGRVLTSSGAPVSGAQVTVRTAGGATFDTRAGRGGAFDFRTLPESAWYDVTAAGGGYAPASVRLSGVTALATHVDVVLSQRVLALAPVAVFGSGMRPLQGFAGATRIIDRSELQRHRPVATHDVLRHVPGVHVQDEDGLGLHLNIGIRGLDPRRSSRVLLLEDGAPIHLGPYTDPSSHYQPPAEVIERVEVIKGAGQIAHGPQTVGGVINFVRRPPPDASGGSLLLRLGNRGQLSGHGMAALAVGRHSTAVSLSRRQAAGARRLSDHEVSDGSVQTLIAFGSPGTLLLKAGAYVERSSWGETGLTAAFTSDEVSSVDGVTPVRGRRVPYAPRHALHAVAGLVGPAGIRLALRTYSLSAQYGDDLNTIEPSEDGQRGRVPGHTVLGATLNYPVRPGTASVFLTADNLANAVHITARQEGVMTGPPRRIAAGLEWLLE